MMEFKDVMELMVLGMYHGKLGYVSLYLVLSAMTGIFADVVLRRPSHLIFILSLICTPLVGLMTLAIIGVKECEQS